MRSRRDSTAEDSGLAIGHLSYVVLGVIALRGPTTSYELKSYVSTSIGYFWPLKHAALYRQPKRLEALGLLTSRTEAHGRRRQFFEITERGTAVLRSWIEEPDSQAPELRDEALLKLHFGSLAEPSAIGRMAEAQLQVRTDRLTFFAELERRYRDWPEHQHALQTLKAGQAFERAFIAFWRELALNADDLEAGRPTRTDIREETR